MTTDDVLIWNNFLVGDNLAFEIIYKKHVQALFKYGLTLTSDEDLIQDCIHDVFIYIYENRKKLGNVRNIRFYLIVALKNELLMAFRRQNIHDKYAESLPEENWIETETVIDQMIENEEEDDRRKLINKTLSILTPRQKEIICHRYITGLSLEEISKQENIDYHSVANIIQRAMKKIKNFYSKSD